MVYEYTKEVAELLKDEELISCFLCIRKGRISFSPFKKYLRGSEFYDELMEWKPHAPHIYLTRKVLVFIYKDKPFKRISVAEVTEMLQLLADKCRELGVKRLLLPIRTFLIEGIAMHNVLTALDFINSEGVDIYYF